MVKHSKFPLRRNKHSLKVARLILNLVKVEDVKLVSAKRETRFQCFRSKNKSQKLKSINFLHKDKTNTKIFDVILNDSLFAFFISILRCVICLLSKSRRIESSTI